MCAVSAKPDKKKLEGYRLTHNSSEESKWSARLRYHFHIDPDQLTDEDFWQRVAELRFVMTETGQWKDG